MTFPKMVAYSSAKTKREREKCQAITNMGRKHIDMDSDLSNLWLVIVFWVPLKFTKQDYTCPLICTIKSSYFSVVSVKSICLQVF